MNTPFEPHRHQVKHVLVSEQEIAHLGPEHLYPKARNCLLVFTLLIAGLAFMSGLCIGSISNFSNEGKLPSSIAVGGLAVLGIFGGIPLLTKAILLKAKNHR